VVENGQIVAGKVLNVRYSYDERIDDGLSTRRAILRVHEILTDPGTHLGCLNDDQSTWRPMVQNIEA
jgi:pyruvate/2-oxoglutarate dehydrogenase complex dihydrolipoamide acyltransferase (E2) component